MGRTVARSFYWVVTLALAILSLRPLGPLESALSWLLAPSRVLAELVAPVDLLQRSAVIAAEEGLRIGREAELDECRALRRDVLRFALPGAPELREGRRFVHARVIGRVRGALDRVEVLLEGESSEGIWPEMPVVCGDVYVGRIRAVDDPHPGWATVDLVAGRDFRVGAVLAPPGGGAPGRMVPTRMVIGGLVPVGRGRLRDPRLAVHNPGRRDPPEGWVRVDEGLGGLVGFREQARGFLLGELRYDGAGRAGVAPEVDYRSGLSQLAIASPSDLDRAPEPEGEDLFDPRRWRKARRLTSGDPTPWRAAFEIPVGTAHGVAPGSAVIRGPRLVGRVERSRLASSSVRLLADEGLGLIVLARIEGIERPFALGRLVSRGRGSSAGAVLFEWSPAVHLAEGGDGPGQLPARLFSGSGEPGVPSGLLIGRTLLPRGPGPHQLEVLGVGDGLILGNLSARVEVEGRP